MSLPSQFEITTPGNWKNLGIGGDMLDAGDVFTAVTASVQGTIVGGSVTISNARPSSGPTVLGGRVNNETGIVEGGKIYAAGRALLFDLAASAGITSPLNGSPGKVWLIFQYSTLNLEGLRLRRELIIMNEKDVL